MTDHRTARAWPLYVGLSLTTCSMLLAQQFLTRVFTILFNSGLAFLAISITFLGLGSAGVAVFALPRLFRRERDARLAAACALAWSLALPCGIVAVVTLDHAAGGESTSLGSQISRVVASSVFLLPAMFLVGLTISLVLRAHAARVGRLYGADLVGGGAGCLLLLPLMRWVGGDQGTFAIAALAALGSALLAYHAGAVRIRWFAAAVTALFALLPLANRDRGLIDVRSHATGLGSVTGWVDDSVELGREWNELSRLGFFATKDRSEIYVRIDSGCQTTIPSQEPERIEAYVARTNFERLPYVLDRHRTYLEIGAGGGRGMVLAAAHGAESITGVEINPGIVAASLAGFPGYGVAALVEDPRRRLVADEGRSYGRGVGRRFETVTITFIQTGIASSSAAFALTEANLFTVEAFVEFLGLCEDDGLFYVYRHVGNEMLRLLAIAREALAELGVEDPRRHLYVAHGDENHAALLISRSPFTEDEVAKLDARCAELGVRVLYSPSVRDGELEPNRLFERIAELRAADRLHMSAAVEAYRTLAHEEGREPIERAFVTSREPEAFAEASLVDIRPTRDDRPYYFFQGLSSWRDFALYFDLAGQRILGGTVILLFWMAAAFAVLVALVILLPLALRRGRASIGRGAVVIDYFSGLGLGYIAVQISFIQRFALFLGHPAYALSVVLLAFLVSSGLGSFASERWFRSRFATTGRTLLLLAAVLLAENLLLPRVFHSAAIGWPVAARVALSIALILPPAFLMGLFFPRGIRLVEGVAPELVPWAWGANSAASVLGSIFALVLAIHFGFTVVACAAAAIYLVFCGPSGAAMARWKPASPSGAG